MQALDQTAKESLSEAIRKVEASSSAEVVIAVRPQSSHFLHVYFAAGTALAFAVHAFLLYSPWEFSLESILLYPLGACLFLVGSCLAVPSLGRALVPRASRRRAVARAARATFYERGVHGTRGRTGMLVYVSLREREAAVVPDVGIERSVPTKTWLAATVRLKAAVRRGAPGADVAEALSAFAEVLGRALPRAADDTNELPDEVQP